MIRTTSPELRTYPPIDWDAVIAAITAHKETPTTGGAYTVDSMIVEIAADADQWTITVRPDREGEGSTTGADSD